MLQVLLDNYYISVIIREKYLVPIFIFSSGLNNISFEKFCSIDNIKNYNIIKLVKVMSVDDEKIREILSKIGINEDYICENNVGDHGVYDSKNFKLDEVKFVED